MAGASCIVTLLLVVLGASLEGSSAEKRYDGHSVLRIVPETQRELDAVVKFQSSLDESVMVWRPSTRLGRPLDIQVSPQQLPAVEEQLRMRGLSAKVLMEDVQKTMEDTRPKTAAWKSGLADFDYAQYHSIAEINAWVKEMTMTYKDMATMFEVGKSFEGQVIYGIKIKTAAEPSMAIWIEGGIHAREWIAPATVIYMTSQLLSQYGQNSTITTAVDSLVWYIVPVLNVDGYNYTWTTDRAWRKTRSVRPGQKCVGVDPNRNWDLHWNESGASPDPCSDQYAGPAPFSEPCVHGAAQSMRALPERLVAFIDFHSYSQLWMTPWGYTKSLPQDYGDQEESSKAAVAALEAVFGTKYDYGSIANIIYVASGSSADWTYGALGVKFSAGVELRDTGKYGFLLPPDQIVPSGQETLQGLLAFTGFAVKHADTSRVHF